MTDIVKKRTTKLQLSLQDIGTLQNVDFLWCECNLINNQFCPISSLIGENENGAAFVSSKKNTVASCSFVLLDIKLPAMWLFFMHTRRPDAKTIYCSSLLSISSCGHTTLCHTSFLLLHLPLLLYKLLPVSYLRHETFTWQLCLSWQRVSSAQACSRPKPLRFNHSWDSYKSIRLHSKTSKPFNTLENQASMPAPPAKCC